MRTIKKRSHRILQQRRQRIFQQAFNHGFNQGYDQGFLKIKKDWSTEKCNALVIHEGVITDLDIGIVQPLTKLNEQEGFIYNVKSNHDITKEMLIVADIIIFLRCIEPATFQCLLWARELGKRTVYVTDEYFLAIPLASPENYSNLIRRETFVKFLLHADLIKVDSMFFGEHIRSQFNPNVAYFPASVDFEWLKQATKSTREEEQMVIGYAGRNNEEDFGPVVPAIQKIIKDFGKKVKIEFFGFIPGELRDQPNVSYIGAENDYKKYLHKLYLCNWDIGLAPLKNDLYRNCKTNTKFLEYAACEIPGIYSNTPVYNNTVTHRITGYLAGHSAEDWYRGIREMIENPRLRETIKQDAERMARRCFNAEECAENWKTQILQV